MRNYMKTIPIILIIGLFFIPGLVAAKPTAVQMIPASFAQLADEAKPSVVNIRTVKNVKGGSRVYEHFFGSPFGNNRELYEHFFGPYFNQRPRDRKEESLGSGFIISESGYIVTNYHVIKGADQIKVVMHDKKEYEAKVIGTDPMTDLALIKIKADNLQPLEFGSSNDMSVGSWVVAIGSPFGLEQTVTAGIISAKGRIIGSGPFDDFIQTDASINPGNSGGPLLNLDGEVIGINTAIVRSGQGIGFAIPSDMATGIIEQLTSNKTVQRGWLGVSILDYVAEEGSDEKIAKGVYVDRVFDGEPAARAGIKAGDIIFQINDKPISTRRDLQITIAGSAVGQRVDVHVLRDGKEKKIPVKLGKRSETGVVAMEQPDNYETFGMRLKTLDDETAKKYGYGEHIKGLVVMDIQQDSRIAGTMVRHGDILIKMNNVNIETMQDYKDYIKTVKKGDVVRIVFRRGNSHVYWVNIRK